MFVITLARDGIEIERREVKKRAQVKRAALEILHELAYLDDGYSVTVEGADTTKVLPRLRLVAGSK